MARIFLHTIIIGYLLVTASAFAQTMSGRIPPLVPWQVQYFTNGMMAPYQGYAIRNEELTAFGRLPDGAWESIDLKPYIPFGTGERNVRGYRMTVRWFRGDGEELTMFYRVFAEHLRRLERAQGRSYSEVRLQWDAWPVSPEGFYALKNPLFTDTDVLVTVP